jgi:pentatricopeptide repeat protein
MGLAILREMIEREIKPDLPVYTTLVNSFRRDRNLQQCWDLHRQVVRGGMSMDETYVAVMIKVYAAVNYFAYLDA